MIKIDFCSELGDNPLLVGPSMSFFLVRNKFNSLPNRTVNILLGKSLIQAILWMPLDTNHLLKLVCRLNKPPWRRPTLMASIPQAGILCAELHINCSGAGGGARRNPSSADMTSKFPRSESEKQRSIEALLRTRNSRDAQSATENNSNPFFVTHCWRCFL